MQPSELAPIATAPKSADMPISSRLSPPKAIAFPHRSTRPIENAEDTKSFVWVGTNTALLSRASTSATLSRGIRGCSRSQLASITAGAHGYTICVKKSATQLDGFASPD